MLGRELFVRRQVGVSADTPAYTLRYASPDVPGDWLATLGREGGRPVALHGASIEQVGGRTVGYAVIGVDLEQSALEAIAHPLGLRVERYVAGDIGRNGGRDGGADERGVA